MVIPGTEDSVSLIGFAQGIERGQQGGRRLQRIDAGIGPRGMGRLALDPHLKMQAAIMGDGNVVGKAGADRVIGLGDALGQQPAGADQPARLLVIGQVQLDRALQRSSPLASSAFSAKA
jgi:hypothetical protein